MAVVWIKQSTAVVISFGPFLDKTDGVTEETGLVSALDHASTGIKLAKNGGALTIRHATVTATTYDAWGYYRVTLDTTDTNTLGLLLVAFNEAATCLPVWLYCGVLPANVYDSLVGGTDALDVSMIQILGTAVATPATAGILDVNVKNIDNDAASASGTVTFPNATLASTTNITAASGIAVSSIGANVITATSIASNAITSAKIATDAIGAAQIAADAIGSSELAASAVNKIVDQNWDELTADHVGPTTQGGALIVAANVGGTLGTPAGATIAADIAAAKADTVSIKAKTDNLPAAPASTTNITAATGVTVATNNDKTGYALSSGGIQAIWDALTSALATAGSIGKRLVDNIDAAISSRSTYAGGDTSGVSTLLSRITGTLAAGTHNAQSGDAYARLGAAGAGLTALGDTRVANLDVAVSTRLATAGYTAPPTAAANATQVRSELTAELGRIDAAISTRLATAGYTAPPSAAANASQVRTELATELAQITLAKKILKNRTQTNPSTGIMTVYDDDGTTPLLTANIYEDVAGTVPYDGSSGVNRRNALS